MSDTQGELERFVEGMVTRGLPPVFAIATLIAWRCEWYPLTWRLIRVSLIVIALDVIMLIRMRRNSKRGNANGSH